MFLLGLKADLRRDWPTLKLNFLNEPTATTRGQVRLHVEFLLYAGWLTLTRLFVIL